MDAMNDKPRMTAEEADARFDALVAQHRREQGPRRTSGPRVSTPTPTAALVLVYVVGVVTGTFTLAKPLVAVIVGVPLLLICRAWFEAVLAARRMTTAVADRWWSRAWDSDFFYQYRRSPIAIGASLIAALCLIGAFGASFIAPHNPFDLASVDLGDARLPPAWLEGGKATYPLGSDEQGRDVLSAILYGSRISIIVGAASVFLSLVIGIALGLLAGYVGGRVDAVIMRVADVQLSFPAILIALLIDGVARAVFKNADESLAFIVLVIAIALSGWVQYARTVRGSTLVEKNREYVQAARVIGVGPVAIMFRHVLPNVTGPVLVLATVHIATAVITEATLSFLGVGVPPTLPSLGTLIRNGNNFLFSGEWWITVFPGGALVLLVLSVNLLGDWLRDALNPRLQ